MQQDTLNHAVPTVAVTGGDTIPAVAEQPLPEKAWAKHDAAKADTLRADPAQCKPLPMGEPLDMKLELYDEGFWREGQIPVEKSDFLLKLDSVTGRTSSLATIKPTGMAGDPVPYLFRNDNFVTITLLLSFFLVVWVISRSRHYLREQTKSFFHERERENMFSERTQTELRGQIFLIFQTCFVLGILFFDFTQEKQVEVFNHVSPYMILGTSVALCSLYYMFKTALYSFVNRIFFERRPCARFNEVYMVCVLALGLALLPVALLVVYFDLSFHTLLIVFFCVLLLDKTILFYKTWRIFFSYRWGWLHLFLYFCALEIVPALILFRILTFANGVLLAVN